METENQTRTIFYIQPYMDSGWSYSFTHIQQTMECEGLPYNGLFYNEALKEFTEKELPKIKHAGVGLDEIFAILGKYGSTIDLIITDGLLNYDLKLSARIRESQLTNAKILDSPIYMVSASEAASIVRSGADFGIDMPFETQETITAIDNIFNGRVGGYTYNPNLYEERDGLLVPK